MSVRYVSSLSTRLLKYNKPRGVLSTTLPTKDGVNILQASGETLSIFFPKATDANFVVPIGRLDKESHGLLLLTTEKTISGALLRSTINHSGSSFTKEYLVQTKRQVSDQQLELLRNGIEISISKKSGANATVLTKKCIVDRWPIVSNLGHPPSVEDTASSAEHPNNTLRFILREGKNRQLRKMIGSLGHVVLDIQRTAFGNIQLGSLRSGEMSWLSDEELKDIMTVLNRQQR